MKEVVATGMVGSLRASLPVGTVVLLDQFLDFSRHHPCTYYEESDFAFLDFTEPFCGRLRRSFRNTAAALDVALVPHGCYVSTEGPRYETRAEVRMFGQLGGDVIGQTVATECVMAREAGLCYAMLAMVTDYDVWHDAEEDVSVEVVNANLHANSESARTIVSQLVASGLPERTCSCGSALEPAC